jgi:cysteine-rich repeat protein
MRWGVLLFLIPALAWAQASAPASQPLRCGDGVVSAGEVCDDRNRLDGDGCSSDCQPEQPASAPAESPPAPPPPAPAPSTELAFRLSLLSTLTIPLVGQVVGPSVGHWYAGEKGRAWVMTGARLALGVTALLFFSENPPGFGGIIDLDERLTANRIGGALTLGVVGLVAVDLWDVAILLPRRLGNPLN